MKQLENYIKYVVLSQPASWYYFGCGINERQAQIIYIADGRKTIAWFSQWKTSTNASPKQNIKTEPKYMFYCIS